MEVCQHLEVILRHEEIRGNIIQEKSEGWSKVNLVITMKKSLDIAFAKTIINSGIKLRVWENKDNHYPIQIGLSCDECKQSIAGPKD